MANAWPRGSPAGTKFSLELVGLGGGAAAWSRSCWKVFPEFPPIIGSASSDLSQPVTMKVASRPDVIAAAVVCSKNNPISQRANSEPERSLKVVGSHGG